MKKQHDLSIGTLVSHTSIAGMYKQTGIVIDSAGTRYGRQYFWVSWTNPHTKQACKSAFWDGVLTILK